MEKKKRKKKLLKLFFVLTLRLVLPVEAWAQFGGECEARPALGGAVSLWTIPMPVDPVLAGAGGLNGLARGTGRGIEASGHAVFPLNRTWAATAEFGAGSRGVEIYRYQDGTEVIVGSGDRVNIQRYTVGVMARRGDQRTVCLYVGGSAGPHVFSYRGESAAVVGVAGKIGIEVPADKIAVYVEVGLNAIFNTQTKSPIADPVLAGVRPTLGMRYRF